MKYKKPSVGVRNPMARAMLEKRKQPQVVPPKRGSKAKYNRQKEKLHGSHEDEEV